jgi:mono/diheme cytochrome c family protein
LRATDWLSVKTLSVAILSDQTGVPTGAKFAEASGLGAGLARTARSANIAGEMKRSTLILLVLVAAVGLGVAAAVSILHNGLSARATPTALEALLARNAHRLSIPQGARETKNPIAASPEALRAARLHFADHCAVCHGNDGGGDSMMGHGLYPKPPDLRQSETQKFSDGELFWIIENGVRFTGMPAFGGPHGSPEDSWKLVLFIRHLPDLAAEEKLEMERYNPKGPEDLSEEQEEKDFLHGAPLQQKPEPAHHH